MKQVANLVAGLVAVLAVFFCACLVESAVRETQRTAIGVEIQDGLPTTASAFVRPDFLWVGDEWWIDIDTDAPVTLEINGKLQAVIPSGSHKLYSNHDVTNTGDYGTGFVETPKSIKLTSAKDQTSYRPSTSSIP